MCKDYEGLVSLCKTAYLSTMHADNKGVPAWEVIAKYLAEHGVKLMQAPVSTELYCIVCTDADTLCHSCVSSCLSYNAEDCTCADGYNNLTGKTDVKLCPFLHYGIVKETLTEDTWDKYSKFLGRTAFYTEDAAQEELQRLQKSM